MSITFDQAVKNMEVLSQVNVTLNVDEKENLGYFSNYNVFYWIFHIISTIIFGSQEYKINQTVLSTLKTIIATAQKRKLDEKPVLFCPEEKLGVNSGNSLEKTGMRILIDHYPYPTGKITKEIREKAYAVLTLAFLEKVARQNSFNNVSNSKKKIEIECSRPYNDLLN